MNEETKRLADDNMRRVDAWNRAASERPDAVPEAAVKAAADAITRSAGGNWSGFGTRESNARAALAAALPFLRAAQPEAGNEPHCTCGSAAVIDANRHDATCWRRLWVENVRDEPEAGSEEAERLRKELQSLVDWFDNAPFLRAQELLYQLSRSHPEADRALGEVETVAQVLHEWLDPWYAPRERDAAASQAALDALDALDAARGRSRDDTVTLAEVLVFLRDDSEPTPPEWLRAADAVEARFGAGRAEDKPPPAKDPTQ